MHETRSNIDALLEHGLTKFNSSASACSLAQMMETLAKAIDYLNAHDFNFLFREDHFDFLLADVRGNEFMRAVRTGDSSIYSGNESSFVIWGKKDVFKALFTEFQPKASK